MTWKETRSRLREDRARVAATFYGDPQRRAWLHPSFVCAVIHRVSRYYYCRGHRQLARLFWHLNTLITGADISVHSDLGGGLLVMSTTGAAVAGTAGRNLTIMACAGLGGEIGRGEDIGAGPGLPIVGDDVVLEPHSGILGPVRVGSRCRIRAGVAVTSDLGDDMIASGPEPRFLKRRDLP